MMFYNILKMFYYILIQQQIYTKTQVGHYLLVSKIYMVKLHIFFTIKLIIVTYYIYTKINTF